MATSTDSERPSTVVVDRSSSGNGVATGLIVLAVIVVALIAAYFLFNANQQDRLRTDAVSGAASSVANSASNAADSVSDAAKAVTPPAPNAMTPKQ